MTYGLSKSKLMAYRQCPRRLWLTIHQPECAEETEDTTHAFAIGHQVGAVACDLHPGGRLIAPEGPLSLALHETTEALKSTPRQPLFEATIAYKDLLVRADILKPAAQKWDLIEVKASTSVKDHYRDDVAIQTYAFQQAGVPIRRSVLQYVNNAFVYPGEGCYHEITANGHVNSLFAQEDLTKDIASLVAAVPRWVQEAQTRLAGPMPPLTDYCEDPYPCPFITYCYGDGPEYPLSILPRLSAKQHGLLTAQGYTDVRDIPAMVLTNDTHEWVRAITVSQQADLRPEAAAVIRALGYPRYYLDFETIQFAVPIWQGTRPYEQLPFQWSCHIESKDQTLVHQEFLDLSGEAPMRAFAESLLATLKTAGPILVYNQAFEGRIIRELAVRFPDLAAALTDLLPRLVDLLPVTRQHYYHPDMKGSWSIKAVLPTIAPDLDYAHLDGVQDGGQAQQAYLEAIAPETPKTRKKAIECSLKTYCGRDTEAMVRLAHFLMGPTSSRR